jgi:hypothetical protein
MATKNTGCEFLFLVALPGVRQPRKKPGVSEPVVNDTQGHQHHLTNDADRAAIEVKMATSKSKKGLWYMRGFESANREDLLAGKESPKQVCQSIGYKFGYQMHRFTKKSADFISGYWDSIEAQREKARGEADMPENTYPELLEASKAIGGIYGSNSHYTEGLARRIEATGKKVADLTVGELMQLHAEYNAYYNKIHR